MSQNCNYANYMSNMQFETELHVHELNVFLMVYTGAATQLTGWSLGDTVGGHSWCACMSGSRVYLLPARKSRRLGGVAGWRSR
jgi:hypothetical protein